MYELTCIIKLNQCKCFNSPAPAVQGVPSMQSYP